MLNVIDETFSATKISRSTVPNIWERLVSWLPRVCSHELLQLSAPRQKKLTDVSFVSISYVPFVSDKTLKETQVNAHVV